MEKVGSPELIAELLGRVDEDGSMHESQKRSKEVAVFLARQKSMKNLSESNSKRLEFINELIEKGLNLDAIKHYLSLYPCWFRGTFPACMQQSERVACTKPCWKERGTYCQVSFDEPAPCPTCLLCDAECMLEEPIVNFAAIVAEEKDSDSEYV